MKHERRFFALTVVRQFIAGAVSGNRLELSGHRPGNDYLSASAKPPVLTEVTI